MLKFNVKILGCSSAAPTLTRNLSAQVLNFHEKLFLLDCGEGTQIQLRKYGVKMQKISRIFISHLHGDHFFGLIGLLSTLNLFGRKKDLYIYSTQELRDIIDLQLNNTETILNYNLIYVFPEKDKESIIYEDSKLIIKAFPMNHRVTTFGFVFMEKDLPRKIRKEKLSGLDVPLEEYNKIKKGADFIDKDGKIFKNEDITQSPPNSRSFAYCSDTIFDEGIVKYIKNVDTLYHEATFSEEHAEDAKNKFHATAKQAAIIAKKASAGKLIIGHFSARYKNLEILLCEAKDEFPNSFLAIEGRDYDINRDID